MQWRNGASGYVKNGKPTGEVTWQQGDRPGLTVVIVADRERASCGEGRYDQGRHGSEVD